METLQESSLKTELIEVISGFLKAPGYLAMRGAYINVVKPAKPKVYKPEVEGFLPELIRNKMREAAYAHGPETLAKACPGVTKGLMHSVQPRTIKEEDAGNRIDVYCWAFGVLQQIEDIIFDVPEGSPKRMRFPDGNQDLDYPLLAALYHVLKSAVGQAEGVFTIPHDACRNTQREIGCITYGDHELGFVAEGELVEALLTVGEKHGVIKDLRRPSVKEDNTVTMGYKYSKPELELALSASVAAKMRAAIASLGPYAVKDAQRHSPSLYATNRGQTIQLDGWNMDNRKTVEYDFSHCV